MNTLSLNDPYGAPPANSGFHPQLNQFGGALYQPLPPSGGFGPPQPNATPIPSGFQPMYTGFGPPRSGPTPMPGFIQPPPSAMGFHQPYPLQPNAPPPLPWCCPDACPICIWSSTATGRCTPTAICPGTDAGPIHGQCAPAIERVPSRWCSLRWATASWSTPINGIYACGSSVANLVPQCPGTISP